jgi:hypothetical protein
MFKFDKSDIQRVATAAVGALVFTSVMVGSAVGPATSVNAAQLASVEASTANQANA